MDNNRDDITWWQYVSTDKYGTYGAIIDRYECVRCGYQHAVAYGVKPIMPFCWHCKRTVVDQEALDGI